jgi:hypothetical protein
MPDAAQTCRYSLICAQALSLLAGMAGASVAPTKKTPRTQPPYLVVSVCFLVSSLLPTTASRASSCIEHFSIRCGIHLTSSIPKHPFLGSFGTTRTMRTSTVFAPLLFAASGLAQAVQEGIAPSASPPSGCQLNAVGNFTIGVLKVGHHSKRESAVEVGNPFHSPFSRHVLIRLRPLIVLSSVTYAAASCAIATAVPDPLSQTTNSNSTDPHKQAPFTQAASPSATMARSPLAAQRSGGSAAAVRSTTCTTSGLAPSARRFASRSRSP